MFLTGVLTSSKNQDKLIRKAKYYETEGQRNLYWYLAIDCFQEAQRIYSRLGEDKTFFLLSHANIVEQTTFEPCLHFENLNQMRYVGAIKEKYSHCSNMLSFAKRVESLIDTQDTLEEKLGILEYAQELYLRHNIEGVKRVQEKIKELCSKTL